MMDKTESLEATEEANGASGTDEAIEPNEFEKAKIRLAEIAEAVADENLSLDAALDLYEEAVAIGLAASDLLEVDIKTEEEEVEAAEAAEAVDVAKSGE